MCYKFFSPCHLFIVLLNWHFQLYIVKYETFFPLWFPSLLSCKAFSTTELHNSISFCYYSKLKSPSLTRSLVFRVKGQGLCNSPISGTRGQERCCLEPQACAEHYCANIKWLIKSLQLTLQRLHRLSQTWDLSATILDTDQLWFARLAVKSLTLFLWAQWALSFFCFPCKLSYDIKMSNKSWLVCLTYKGQDYYYRLLHVSQQPWKALLLSADLSPQYDGWLKALHMPTGRAPLQTY